MIFGMNKSTINSENMRKENEFSSLANSLRPIFSESEVRKMVVVNFVEVGKQDISCICPIEYAMRHNLENALFNCELVKV